MNLNPRFLVIYLITGICVSNAFIQGEEFGFGTDSNSTHPNQHCKQVYASNTAFLFVLSYSSIIIFLFVGLALVCDDYFVPVLEIIAEALNLPESVNGATFMAAGSSAPELFTSLVAIVQNENDVGVGTITGSAIFNLLVIIAGSAFVAPTVLLVDWKPFIRDCLFYLASIIALILFAWDGAISWYEAIILLIIYFFYIVTMFFNNQLMNVLEEFGNLLKSINPNVETEMSEMGNGKLPEKVEEEDSKNEDEVEFVKILCLPKILLSHPEHKTKSKSDEEKLITGEEENSVVKTSSVSYIVSWIKYIFLFPHALLFALTIPKPSVIMNIKIGTAMILLPFAFLMSITMIGIYTYLTVFVVTELACILEIPNFMMSLIVIAAGTSIPDMIASLIVARQGKADEAVSNALGSNIFDINLGLGLPFFLFFIRNGFSTKLEFNEFETDYFVQPESKFGFILLFVMVLTLLFLVLSKFKLTKRLGAVLLILYCVFILYAFLQDIICNNVIC